MTREQRTRQLLDVAWALVRGEGTGALTLGRLAEAAGVTKPVAYDHFVTRNGLLAALYDDYDGRQTVVFHERIVARPGATGRSGGGHRLRLHRLRPQPGQ